MWLVFATTLNVSLRWLRGLPLAALGLGAVGGPLAYWGGERLGAMTFVVPVAATAAIAVGWVVLTPVLVRLARRFDGYAPAAPASRAPRDAVNSPRCIRCSTSASRASIPRSAG